MRRPASFDHAEALRLRATWAGVERVLAEVISRS